MIQKEGIIEIIQKAKKTNEHIKYPIEPPEQLLYLLN